MSNSPIRTIDELVRTRAITHANIPILSYPSDSHNYVDYTASVLNSMTQRAAKRYCKILPKLRRTSDEPRLVVAVLGATNIEYIVTLAVPAYLHLLEKTECSVVFVQPRYQKIMEQTRELKHGTLDILPMVHASYITASQPEDSEPLQSEIDPVKETNKIGWIIHSSGSTGFPKPIGHTHSSCLTAAMTMNITFQGLVTQPLFHAYGLYTLVNGLIVGRKVSFYNADLPVTGPNILKAIEVAASEVLFTVPYVVKLLAETEGAIAKLKELRQIVLGGASFPDSIGDKLASEGVKLGNYYGTTEAGIIMKYSKEHWNWLQVFPGVVPYARWEPKGDDLYQLVVLPGWGALVASNRPDGSYATGDLFLRHPKNPNVYKYMDRADDIIVLSNGEKANPTLLEDATRRSRYVTQAVVFGAGKPTLGLIVVASDNATGMTRDEIISGIWPDIEKGNTLVPAYAKISRDAVIIKSPGTEFPRTDKGTAIRTAFLRTFDDDIQSYYDSIERNDTQSGKVLSEAEIRQLVRKTVLDALQMEDDNILKNDTDFFSLGLDSLMAINIRRKLAQEINTSGKTLSSNIVFEKPNVDTLTRYLSNLKTGTVENESSAEEVMQTLVEKYSTFRTHIPGNVVVDGEYVILTGGTGSLGAHVLSTLVQRPTVHKVYCFVRASSPEAGSQRVLDALQKAHLLDRLTEQQKDKIIALPADLSQESFGLPAHTIDQITREVTTIIHGAWSVNFNMDVTSFEQQHIRGSWNLINLCLSSPHANIPTFNFISSISTAMSTGTLTIPEVLPKLSDAMPMGYAQAKLVTEHICHAAAAKSDIAARILRVGQIVGDTHFGMWNATEAVPLTIQSATTIGALPVISNGDEEVSWIPVDTTANTVVDLSLLDKMQNGYRPAHNAVFHVCHPSVLRWNRDVLPALKNAGLEYEAVDQREWVKRLEASEQDGEKNPPIKLLDFFRKKYGRDEATTEPYFETKESCRFSPSLRNAKEVDAELIGRFLRYWREECW
ncbi:acetyl-CoA synthetase-like protein [Wilcoxina mikolae CBS 423.85]|nr:acetyl-CoA synthetase-like protein [Wilcoxina mikolae CBS 423.85]